MPLILLCLSLTIFLKLIQEKLVSLFEHTFLVFKSSHWILISEKRFYWYANRSQFQILSFFVYLTILLIVCSSTCLDYLVCSNIVYLQWYLYWLKLVYRGIYSVSHTSNQLYTNLVSSTTTILIKKELNQCLQGTKCVATTFSLPVYLIFLSFRQ